MKLVYRNLVRNGPGHVKLLPEEEDDLWHCYNLIVPGDTVEAYTVRYYPVVDVIYSFWFSNCDLLISSSCALLVVLPKLEEELGKVLRDVASGARESERVKLKLAIVVESVDYDKEGAVLRARGKNITENEHVKLGQYHTMELEAKRQFTLTKDMWDWVALDTIQQACDPAASADLAVILMQEGLAHLFLIGRSITVTKARIETSIPRKHGPAIAGYESALKKFFEHVLQALIKLDFEVIQCVVIASPGFTKDQFRDYAYLEAARRDERKIIENKSRIVLAHAPSGYKHSLKEVLDSPSVMTLIKDTKAAQEVQALKDFYNMLTNDSARACYGPKHVEIANERLAIQTLLITDNLFRNSDIATRQNYVRLVQSVKKFGGTVHIFSTMHVSGEQLAQLTGIAAILRFPLPDLEDIEM
uniref:Protein pelota homolog n=1 Tax=Leersia perrieri TaxID=77586 RepID=A0A0D9WAN7_9ORYZ